MKPAHAVVRRAEQRAKARASVVMLENPTLPPSVEAFWQRSWFVLYVAPFQERRVSQELGEAGFDVFMPVRTYWNASRCRVRRQLEQPLLVRYLFVGAGGRGQRHISDADRHRIKDVEGVLDILGDAMTALSVPVENLISLAGQQIAGEFDTTQEALLPGTVVSITGGPFTSFGATVRGEIPRNAPLDFSVEVVMKMLGRETITHIPLEHLRKSG